MNGQGNSNKTEEIIETFQTPIMTDSEFAELGEGEWAYIKSLTAEEAQEAYPTIEELPSSGEGVLASWRPDASGTSA